LFLPLCLAAALSAPPPQPLQANLGLIASPLGIGAEGEVAFAALHLGGLTWRPIFGSEYAQTAWAGLGFSPRPGDRLMAIAGGTHYVQGGVGCLDVCTPFAEYGLLVGLSYLVREERFWLQLTPQYLFPIGGPSAYPSWALSGLPWVEVGFPVNPNCDISLRLGETLVKVAFKL
jgi:hypothetical protein